MTREQEALEEASDIATEMVLLFLDNSTDASRLSELFAMSNKNGSLVVGVLAAGIECLLVAMYDGDRDAAIKEWKLQSQKTKERRAR